MGLARHSASGPAAGFLYQFDRALAWLAKSPASFVVAIEAQDDVSVIDGSNDVTVLEQDKHSIQDDGKPFGDRSKNLWKTLQIWLEAVEAGEVDIGNVRFFMVTNKSVGDCLARRIGQSQSKTEIDKCLAGLNAVSKDPPAGVKAHMERVLRPDSAATLSALISKCEFVDGSDKASGASLRQETIAHLPLPSWCLDWADSIVDELLGWLHKTAMTMWQEGRPALIPRDHFVNELYAVLDRRRRVVHRERAANLIPVSSDQVGGKKGSPFVKQLYLITDDDEIVDSAIRDFIRCSIEQSRLSSEGNVTDDDWVSFEQALLARWEKIQKRVVRMSKGVEEPDVGFQIYAETTEDHREKLAGNDTEQVYLTAGTYHKLAEALKVGWHPRYQELIAELLKP